MKRTACMAAFIFTWTLGHMYAQEPASSNSRLKHRNNAASATEKIPADSWSLAAYFRELASQEKALSDSYERMATIYKTTKPPTGLDAASAREFENQYKCLAETEARAAAAAADIAAYHSRMADVVVSASLVATHIKADDAAFRK